MKMRETSRGFSAPGGLPPIPLNAAKVRTFLYIHKIFGLFSSFLISRKLSFCWAKEGSRKERRSKEYASSG